MGAVRGVHVTPVPILQAPPATPDEVQRLQRHPVLRRELPNGDQFVVLQHHTTTAMVVLAGTHVDIEPLNGPYTDTAEQLLKLPQADAATHTTQDRPGSAIGTRTPKHHAPYWASSTTCLLAQAADSLRSG